MKRIIISNEQNNSDIGTKDKNPDVSDTESSRNLDNNNNNNKDVSKDLRKRLRKIRENFSDLKIIQWTGFFLEIIFIIPLILRLFKTISPSIKISKHFIYVLLFLLMIFFVILFSGLSNKLIYCYKIDNENTLSLFYNNQQLQALDETLKRSDDLNKCSHRKFILFKNFKELKKINTFILEFIYSHILEKNELSRKNELTNFSQFDTVAISEDGNFFAGSATSGDDNTSTERSHLLLWNDTGKIQDVTEPQIEIKDLKFWQTCLISSGRNSINIWNISQGKLNEIDRVNIKGIVNNIEKIKISRYSNTNLAYFSTIYNGVVKVWELSSQCKLPNNQESIFEINDTSNQILDIEFIKESQQYIDMVTFSKRGDMNVWRYNKNTNKLDPIHQQKFIAEQTDIYELHVDLHRKEKYLSIAINSPNSELYEIQLWSFKQSQDSYVFKEVGTRSYTKLIKKIELDQQESKIVILDKETLYIHNILRSNDQLKIEDFSQYSVNDYNDFEIFPLGKQILLAGNTVKILNQTSDKKRGIDYSPVNLEYGIDEIKTRNLIYPNNDESGVSTILIKDQKHNLYYYDLSLKPFGNHEESIKSVDYSEDGLAILKTALDGTISLLDPNRKLKQKVNLQDQLDIDNAVFYPSDSSVIVTLNSSQNLISFIDINSANLGHINTSNINKSVQFDFDNKGEYLGIVYDNQPYSNPKLGIWKIVKEQNNITSPIHLLNSIETKAFAFYFSDNNRYVFILDKDGKINLKKINENPQDLSLDDIEIEINFNFISDLNSEYKLDQDWEKIMILPDNKVVLAKKNIISIFELSQTNSTQLKLSNLFQGNWQSIGNIEFINKYKNEEIIIGDTQGSIYKISLYADDDIIKKSCIWLDDYYDINEMPQICENKK